MNVKRRLLIMYDWFYPGFKAGGPIQSLTNLTLVLLPYFDIFVITGANDLNSDEPYDNVKVNDWNIVQLPSSNIAVNIYYAEKRSLDQGLLTTLFQQVEPEVIYLNGIFSYRFFLMPLLQLKKSGVDRKIIVCPRGMLKEGALSGKAFKKKIYLLYLHYLGVLDKVYWHATTEEEVANIKKQFLKNRGVITAPNIPKMPIAKYSLISKKPGKLNLVYLSLINEHKNLLLLLQVIGQVKLDVTLEIYGPVIDEVYWKKCLDLIEKMPAKVKYHGLVEPEKVQDLISQYHALILFTKGENFGHAIYECLSVGRPVITSHFTPWQNLLQRHAGANVDVNSMEECIHTMHYFAELSETEYHQFCSSAYTVAMGHYTGLNFQKNYLELFA